MGATLSTAVNEVSTSVNQSITSTFNAEVTDSVNIACSNTVIVDGATNCNITFGSQYCSAIGISTLSANISNQDTLIQDTYTSIKEKAQSVAAPTLANLNFSNSYNGLDSVARMAIKSAKDMTVACTRNASGANLAQVKDCTNSTIYIGPQTITVEVMGTCSANLSNETQASNTLKQLFDLDATSKAGFEIGELIAICIIIGIVLTVGTVIARKQQMTGKRVRDEVGPYRFSEDPQNPQIIKKPNNGKITGSYVCFGFAIFFLVAWLATCGALNFPPFPFIPAGPCTADRNNPLQDNELTNLGYVSNDGRCLESQASPCNGEYRGYQNCGIINGGCQNAEVLTKKQQFQDLSKWCAIYGLYDETAISEGTDQELGEYMFNKYLPDGCTQVEAEGPCSTTYTDCVKCTNGNNSLEANLSFFSDTSILNPQGTCNSLVTQKLIYISSDENTGLPAPTDPLTGNPAWGYDSNGNNPIFNGTCKNSGFQQRMKILVQYRYYLHEIINVKNSLPEKFADWTIPQLCGMKFQDLFDKCDKEMKCTYEALNPNDEAEVRSCHNDVENCTGADFENDKEYIAKIAEVCVKNIDNYNAAGWGTSVTFMVVILALLIGGIVLIVQGKRLQKAQYDALTAQQKVQMSEPRATATANSSSLSVVEKALVGIFMILTAGCIATGIGLVLSNEGLDTTAAAGAVAMGYGILSGGVVLLLLIIALVIYVAVTGNQARAFALQREQYQDSQKNKLIGETLAFSASLGQGQQQRYVRGRGGVPVRAAKIVNAQNQQAVEDAKIGILTKLSNSVFGTS